MIQKLDEIIVSRSQSYPMLGCGGVQTGIQRSHAVSVKSYNRKKLIGDDEDVVHELAFEAATIVVFDV